MASEIALVIFAYNRPSHLQNLLSALDKSDLRLFDIDIFINYDGAKDQDDLTRVMAVRNLPIPFECTSYKADVNYGLADSIIKGVSIIFKAGYKSVIVLEDDLIVDEFFFTYMVGALEYYGSCGNIGSVTGFNYDKLSALNGGRDVFYSKRFMSWSWGTWADRWSEVDWDTLSSYKKLKNLGLSHAAGDDLNAMYLLQINGLLDSWAIRFSAYHLLSNKYCVYPFSTQILNKGFDGSGTHCGRSAQHLKSKFERLRKNNNWDYGVSFDEIVWDAQKQIYRTTNAQKMKNIIKFCVKKCLLKNR